jgi:Leucine-rich repeat (LRR) protein
LPREGRGDDIVRHAATDRAAANFVLDIGKSVWIDDRPDPVSGSSSSLPFHKFKLRGIGLEGLRNLTPEDFAGFRHCRSIKELNLNDTAVTDEHLKVFENTTAITRLSLNGAKVTSKGLSYFAGCGRMRILSAWAVPVDDTFIRSVANPEFTFLNLGATRITDASMEAFGGFSKLTWATLNLTGLSDKGVACLKDAKQLTYLGLNGSKITDQSAEVFATMENLEELTLNETSFTDGGLDRLIQTVPKLRTFELKKTKVTKEGIQRFHASHPQCRVSWDEGELEPVD